MYDSDTDVKRVVDVAKGLEGLKRSDGIHAAVVITKGRSPLPADPAQARIRPGSRRAPVVTQFEMGGVESLGLLKMDFLGLRNLDVITDTQAMIRRSRDPEFDIDTIPLDDRLTFDLLGRGTRSASSSSSRHRCGSCCGR
jgi:DNA polymerase-3 subunit alpha